MIKSLHFLAIFCAAFIIVTAITGVYKNSVTLDEAELQLTNDSNALLLISEQSKLIESLSFDKEEALVKLNELLLKLDELVVTNNKLRITVADKDETISDLERELYLIKIIVETLRDQIDDLKDQVYDFKITPLPPNGPA